MNKVELEQQINKAFSNAVPDVLDSVLTQCKEQKRKVIEMTEQRKRNPWARRILAIAAALAIVIVGITGFVLYRHNFAVDSAISLDVNPSIEILVNQKERVLQVNALNDDAKKVIEGMDFKNSDLNVAVNALVGSMLRNGYISELSNSILISVNNDNPQKSAELQKKLMQEVNALLQTDSFSGAVLSQTVNNNAELKKLADSYGITLGKAQLIKQIVNQNPLYTFEKLVPLSINELNLLSAASNANLENISSMGQASDKDYIGAEKAQSIALSHAGLAANETSGLHSKLDYEDGVMIYEVEFYAKNLEYDYEINATTGEIIKSQKDKDNDLTPPPSTESSNPSGSDIGKDKAKEIAFAHAGVKGENVRELEIELEHDNGVLRYEISFKAKGYEYDYEINAATGAILQNEKELDD